MSFGRIGAVVGTTGVLLSCWVGAHYTRSMAPSPWTAHLHSVPQGENAFELVDGYDTTRDLDEFLEAAPEDRALVYSANQVAIERALRSSQTFRESIETRRRFVMDGTAVLETLALWKHRSAAILVEDDPARALALSLSLWRHSVDAAETCDAVIACSLSAVMTQLAMSAAESVTLHFGTATHPAVVWRVQNFRREIAASFREAPTMVRAIENEYRFVRAALEETSCVPLDRSETEVVFRGYYGRLRDYADGTTRATAGLLAGPAGDFSRLYNPCGRMAAEMAYMNLVPILDEHREAFAEIARRQRAILTRGQPTLSSVHYL